MRNLFVLAILGTIGVAQAAPVETVVQTATRWGIVGNWQKDCSASVSENNDRQAFVVRDGRLYLDRDTGRGQDSNRIVSAIINTRGQLELVIDFATAGQRRLNVHERLADGRDHIVLNRDADTGQDTVRDGRLLHNGVPTPTMTRCN